MTAAGYGRRRKRKDGSMQIPLTHSLADIIENVSESAPALAPLFRSDQQMRLLGVLFTGSDPELSITDLAERAGVAQSTASREVARLADHGIVVVRHLGRNALVAANWDLPWATELRSILTKTVGVLGRLSDALHVLDGVDEAWVFGSWAARFRGEPGPPPRDVDIVVVGNVALRQVRAACRGLIDELGVEVNPIVVTHDAWNARDDVFVTDIRTGPLVPIPHATRVTR